MSECVCVFRGGGEGDGEGGWGSRVKYEMVEHD